MANPIEEILAETGTSTPKPASEPQAQAPKEDEEARRKKEQLDNLNRAIAEANETLKKTRSQIKQQPIDEELPKINFEDPSVKAWVKEIDSKVAPVNSQLEKEKEEIRTFALREFLADKPALAAEPEKVRELVAEYEALSKGKISERTKEGVMTYLQKAYASVNHDQLINIARNARIEKAQADALLSDIAVSRGATTYQAPKEQDVPLNEEEKEILRRWGMTPDEWQADAKKYK